MPTSLPPTTLKPDVKDAELESQDSTSFVDWLISRGITNEDMPFISIADSKYMQPLNHLKARLDKWPSKGYSLVVICLDVACTESGTFNGYGGYLSTNSGAVMNSVALIKFQITLDLSKRGYNFVFLDGDVYLTGSRDPMLDMLSLQNETWDIQFQYDSSHNEHESTATINIGWIMSKATPATIEFYERSYKLWQDSHMWDQKVMNIIVAEMEKNSTLRVNRLWNPRYQNWMMNDWQTVLFGNETATQEFINEASVIHFTCVEQALKTYFGAGFGGFGDYGGYYSRTPPLLRVANVSGLVGSVHAQIAFAGRLANTTGRTLIWPDTVSLLQNNTDGKIVYAPSFPGVRTLSYDSVQHSGVDVVEGRYLINRMTETRSRPLKEVIIDPIEVFGSSGDGPARLEREISTVRSNHVVVLDFSNFQHNKWLEALNALKLDWKVRDSILISQSEVAEKSFQEMWVESGMMEYSQPIFEKIRQCSNANDKWPHCLHICT